MKDLTTIDTGEMKVYVVRNQHWEAWMSTAHECQTRDVYRVKQLVASGFKPAKIVDIGAQTGMYTSMAGKYFPDSFIYAFEPVHDWFKILALNSPKNSMPINACVLGHLDSDGPKAIDHTNGDEVKWRTGEKGFANRGISVTAMMKIVGQIDLLKIDCEGSEVNIFRDMDGQGLLKDIQWIVGEYHFDTAKQEVVRILAKTHRIELREENKIDLFFAERLK